MDKSSTGFRALVRKVLNKETILYVVFGVLTTVVNYVVSVPLYHNLPVGPEPLRNAIANCSGWILSVAFAFVTNKLFVFESKSWAGKLVLREAVTFVSARLLSFGVELAGMWLLVSCLNLWFGASKIAMNVIVILMNYVLSKWIIFKKKKQ